jgi:hypothetical protein
VDAVELILDQFGLTTSGEAPHYIAHAALSAVLGEDCAWPSAGEFGKLLAERDRLLGLLRRVRLRLFDGQPEHALERDIMDTLDWYGDGLGPLEDYIGDGAT